MWIMPPTLQRVATGGFPVPGAIKASQLPPEAKLAILRLLEAPPKPAVSLSVMNQTQFTMLGPDLPTKSNV